MTGLPVSEYAIGKDFRTFLVIIDAAIKKNQIVVVEGIGEEVAETKDLAADHSYQIIEVKKNSILVRNLISNDLTSRLSFEEAMIFSKLMIFRSENSYVYISRTLRHKQGCYSLAKATFKTSTKCYWEVWENSEVYYKSHIGSQIDYRKSLYTIKIKRVANEELNCESGFQEQLITESGK
jgi:hypothetical protein